MKSKNTTLFTYYLTVIGAAFLMINLKKHYIDSTWDYSFSLMIFIFNGNELSKYYKNKKDEKMVEQKNIKN